MVQTSKQRSVDQLASTDAVTAWLEGLGARHSEQEATLIWQAIELAREAHKGQQRASGEPYVNHVIAVADILVNLHLDADAIIAAILHDVVEDSDYTLDYLSERFGHTVANLVDGVTKMKIIDRGARPVGDKAIMQAESLRKLLLAMAEDVRVVLIKLADRLHNMRTLKYLPESKQLRIARETLDIYAPLANRWVFGKSNGNWRICPSVIWIRMPISRWPSFSMNAGLIVSSTSIMPSRS